MVRLFGMMGRVLGGEQKNDGTKSLFDFLFNAITRKKANKLSSVDWESNWIPLKQADEEERLKFGFDLLDFRGTGKLALEDFVDIIRAAHSTLAIVGLSAPVLNSYNFATYFFNLLSNGKPFLTFNDFKHSFPVFSPPSPPSFPFPLPLYTFPLFFLSLLPLPFLFISFLLPLPLIFAFPS